MTDNSQTVYALSSGALPAAIAIVRISGPQASLALSLLGANNLICFSNFINITSILSLRIL